ncbi:glycoside hydrolase family 3 domain protein [Pseudopedobacter saltans DSM 12145]|uniref:beta-N-acetylhexosaminidase n=1 Tax=Pseudopedobacter saltans (strain ATCC 51119 / DSM 12145 / JCM 21818 / CCUG 39354 / LMG 10337 / NBRC 100064 / NCIMB 13643) TaxID=762903 RepID=F0S8T4_PSESL|nr:glycoside hydrolase family 3 N-terminal domain-containing protein [Pseudopedobacter saltans]ADY52415.1 glycoside hydrolase family 3 domain protein [Pseudopedobacter saltans DSM 12145]
MKKLFFVWAFCSSLSVCAQEFLQKTPEAVLWADSVQKKLNKKQKIAQLMVIRVSERQGNKDVFFEEKVSKDIRKYKIGALCLFQGAAVRQAEVLNRLQSISKVPLMVTVDGETGLGMRFSDVKPFPNQLTMGATRDTALAYRVGKAIADQCHRAGIQVNYAPVVDINNNPANPVINVRSFGENKEMVALMGTAIMKGMQDEGIMACAKHFPGHGDVNVDSHYDLPVILKSREELNNLELFPFKALAKAGVGSMMMAHLYIPAIDTEENKATSLSKNNVTDLLRNEIAYQGLTFTDALEMKGVAKFYPQGLASAKSIIAGNDMLCLPGDIRGSVKSIRKAIRKGELSWKDIDQKVNRVLLSKYHLGLNQLKPVDTTNITADLNKDVYKVKTAVYEKAITVLNKTDSQLFDLSDTAKVAYVGVGLKSDNNLSRLLKSNYNTDVYLLANDASMDEVTQILNKLNDKYGAIILGLHQYSKNPANNFGISASSISLINAVLKKNNVLSLVFGSPYVINKFTAAKNLVACYEDDEVMQETAFKLLRNKITTSGRLPVSIDTTYPYGAGL